MAELLVELKEIQPNPYQMRLEEDPQTIEEIAVSIVRHGLMQTPSARKMEDGYQLVFGHTRRQAFELLASKGVPAADIEADPQKFGKMPLQLREGLSEREMFELALAENVKRSDLNPIEVAKSLQRYMDEFEATSEEAGELFGLKGATVRGKVRLLDLPESVQEKVANGEIVEGAARKLLTLQRIAPSAMTQAADEIAQGEDFEEVVSAGIEGSDGVVRMHSSWSSGEPRGGDYLWPLKTPEGKFPALPELTWSQALKALGMESNADNRALVEDWIAQIEAGAGMVGLVLAGQSVAKIDPEHAEAFNKLYHLMKPPACTACPFYAKADGNHYCGWAACHARKKAAWRADVLAKASTKLKIPIYDKAKDGALKVDVSYWNHKKDFEERHEDLRLFSTTSSSYYFDELPDLVKVVFVGKKAKAIKKNKARSNSNDDWEKRRRLRDARVKALKELVLERALDSFVPAIAKLDNLAILEGMAHSGYGEHVGKRPAKKAPKKEHVAWLQRSVVAEMVWDVIYRRHSFEDQAKAVELAGKHLRGMAKEWGVKLPADWLKQTREVQAKLDESVATETEGKKNG